MKHWSRIAALVLLASALPALLLTHTVHASSTAQDALYIAELYCNGHLAAVGIVVYKAGWLTVSSAYPPIAFCYNTPIRTGVAIEYVLTRGTHIDNNTWLLRYGSLELKVRLYEASPGSHVVPALYAITVIVSILAIIAILRRDELEVL